MFYARRMKVCSVVRVAYAATVIRVLRASAWNLCLDHLGGGVEFVVHDSLLNQAVTGVVQQLCLPELAALICARSRVLTDHRT